MPSYLDFDTTKKFRNYILGKTLTVPNGPQTFNSSDYMVQKTSDMSNVDPGDVETVRPEELVRAQTSNVFKPIEYFVNEDLKTIPRRANLSLYPYFETDQYHSFVSIISNGDYTNESELMKFAAWNIKSNEQGPFFARTKQNLYTTTAGKIRVLDALQGNTATAINLITGREPLIETNTKITVAKTLPGKAIDFLQTVTGVEFPWSEIPGDYLSNPKNPVIARPESATEAGRFFQDATGALGSLFGIQRRPTVTRKPSDLFLEYTGQRQKSTLYDNLSYSKYGPDYTTTARSQNTSKIFTFVDNLGESAKTLLGLEAPRKLAYIGDDRAINVKDAMSDFNDRQVRSSYYLSLLFDEVQAIAFQRSRNISEGGGIGGNLTWISSNSRNKLGEHNEEYASEQSHFIESLSTNFSFRENSILGLTQEILETMPTDGGAARSHVSNVIDQTSRVFREDGLMMSRGSAIKYVDKFTGNESGVEYCRVWTKDRSYMNYSDTMKTSTLSRKFNSSVLSKPWNLNIYPNSNGNGEFDSGSTNMAKGNGDGFYAKKYMFSIENLAWRTSNTPGFTYNDLPYCERGGNGGRIMWFPPYGLKVTEQNSAKWEENDFLGRPEPVYTYQNTSRAGTVQFKVIVDHPSILNLLVREHFKNMSDEEADNYINAFFAGCEEIDFYSLIRRYTTLNESDVKRIQAYLNENKDPETVKRYKTVITPAPPVDKATPTNTVTPTSFNTALYFRNDYPDPGNTAIVTNSEYDELYTNYIQYETQYIDILRAGLYKITDDGWTPEQRNDYEKLSGKSAPTRPTEAALREVTGKTVSNIIDAFEELRSNYTAFKNSLSELKTGLATKKVKNVNVKMYSSTSSAADDHYNLDLSYRRSHSIIKEIINQIATDGKASELNTTIFWKGPDSTEDQEKVETPTPISLKKFGYPESEGDFTIEYVKNVGEQTGSGGSGTKNVNCGGNPFSSTELRQTAPSTFWCRETTVDVEYEVKDPDEEKAKPIEPKKTLVEINDYPDGYPSPAIDEMKRIIMKTLSECYYFKKLEDDSPNQFSSLKEKLRYFHPAFHSMTPEGLNARLTFLQQCIRPGETLPIKGISDASDLNARNTTFGPPPICVMRIGDFYNSKVVIRDVNIEFDEDLWDLNPEGIGVQPMIANVTLQLNFIGGHGLAKPVERLQNALSSNFYANSEVYDPRSISTETTIANQDATKFTKEFLEDLVSDYTDSQNSTSQDDPSNESSIIEGRYIGDVGSFSTVGITPIPTSLKYKDLVDNLYSLSKRYYSSFADAYNDTVEKYGTIISSMILSPTYRSINDYTVQTGAGTETIQLLGNYPKANELEVLLRTFKSKMLDKIKTENISTIFGFDKELTTPVLVKSEEILNPHIYKRIGQILDEIPQNRVRRDVEPKRDELIKTFDKLNFVIETGHDGSIIGETYTGVNFSGYTYDLLYNRYSDVVRYINEAEPLFSEDLDTTSYVFGLSTTMTTANLTTFLSELLKEPKEKEAILNLYTKDKTVFTESRYRNIEKRLNKFMASIPSDKNFSRTIDKKEPIDSKSTEITFGILDFDYTFSDDEKTKLRQTNNLSPNRTINTLNYYRS